MEKRAKRFCLNHISFTVLLGATVFVYIGSIGPYTSGILTTMQREFQLKSSEVGVILSINDIVALILVTPTAYIGTSRHRPRILGVLTIFFTIGCFMCALPQFAGNRNRVIDPTSSFPFNETANAEDFPSNSYGSMQSKDICEVELDGGGEDNECSKEELDASGAQYGRALWFLVGQGFIGLGSTGYWTLGLTYMDDGLPSKAAPYMYFATLFMLVSVSPLTAFALSGLALSLHTDFYKIDVDELGYGSKDPRWIGAWWLGYVIYGLLMGLIAIPYFFFPKMWPEKDVPMDDMKEKNRIEEDDDQPTAAFLIKSNLPDPDSTILGIIKGYFSAVRRLATNMTYSTVIMSSVADSIMFSGFFSFLGRYLQTQYDVTPSMTSIILGLAITPAGVVGNFFGGLFFRRLKLSLKGIAGAIIISAGISLVILAMMFVVSCDTSSIAGLNFPYPDGTETLASDVATATCMSNCSCQVGVYTPVCGSNGLSYVTPCHAGCTDQRLDEVSGKMIFSNCSCIGSNVSPTTSAYDDNQGSTAVLEKCSADCDSKKYAFIVLLAVLFFSLTFLNVPEFFLFMRVVENKDRAVGIAFSSLLQRVLAFIPAPIFFGTAIQTTCIMFQESCGITGNCLVYDNIRLSRVVIGLVCIFKVLSLVMSTLCYFTIRRNEAGEYQYLQLCKQENLEDRESQLAALTLEEVNVPFYPYETRV